LIWRGTLSELAVSNKVNEFLAGFPPQEVAMNRVSRLALILSFASTASLAQVSGMGFPLVPLETNCPIGVRATLEKSRSLFAPQRLEVTLTNHHLPVSYLGITVHGMAPVANSPAPSETTESLVLNRVMAPRPYTPTEQKESPKAQGQMGELDAILGTIGQPVLVRSTWPQRGYAWVTGFTAVNFIDLDSVSYADGTSWHVSNGKTSRLSLADAP
jgi:hypothetical protein